MNCTQLGYTSDHVWRLIETEKIKGFTWNLLCYMFSKQDFGVGYSNNPFNITEDRDMYLERN